MKRNTHKNIADFIPNLEQFTISVAGLNKNSGKTVFLVYLINQLYNKGINVAVTSIGFDGEKRDMIFNHQKPEFVVPEGTFIATAELALNNIDGEYLILDDLDDYGPLGKIYIIRANEELSVELVGPSSVDGLLKLRDKISKYSKQILIDGAYNRFAQISPKLAHHSVLAVGGTNIDKTKSRLQKLSLLKLIPKYLGNNLIRMQTDNNNYKLSSNQVFKLSMSEAMNAKNTKIFLSGALTNNIAKKMISNGNTIIIKDITKIFLSTIILNKLIDQNKIFILSKTDLILVTYNPKNFTGADYQSKTIGEIVSNYFGDIECCDVVSSYCYKGGELSGFLE